MALPNVYIEVVRDGLGLVSTTNDNTMGICLSGVAVTGKLVLNQAFSIYSLEDAKKKGITPVDNADAYRHVREFYDVAGQGKKLWIIVSPLSTKLSATVKVDNSSAPARLLLSAAAGEISVLGITSSAAYTATVVDGLSDEVWKAQTDAQLLADEYGKKIMPFVSVIEGQKFSGEEDELKDLSQMDKYRTAIVLASTKTDGSASVGLVLGQLAALPVQRKISRVKNGQLPTDFGYLSDGVSVDDREFNLGVMHDKRYIVFRKFPNKSGYFFSGDPTAAAETDDLNIIARTRIMDKAVKIAYNTYVEELDDDVEITEEGTLHPAVCAYLQSKIEQQVNGNMQGEISSFNAAVDTTSNILSGEELRFFLTIIPKGYLNPIKVVLGFSNPFNN